MILFLRDDLILETFDSPDTPPSHIEWIDVKNGEYSFCSDRGQAYSGEFIHHGGFFRNEKWQLIPDGEPDINNALNLANRAVAVDTERCAFGDLESLRLHLQS